MKKIIALAAALVAFTFVASAAPRALGVRATYGAEISYQQALGSNFGEFDLGWRPGAIEIVGVYDFVFANSGNFNFYAGPGAGLSLYRAQNEDDTTKSGLGIAVLGQVGAEYAFPGIPFNISIDWRPAFRFVGLTGLGWDTLALGFRYRF